MRSDLGKVGVRVGLYLTQPFWWWKKREKYLGRGYVGRSICWGVMRKALSGLLVPRFSIVDFEKFTL